MFRLDDNKMVYTPSCDPFTTYVWHFHEVKTVLTSFQQCSQRTHVTCHWEHPASSIPIPLFRSLASRHRLIRN
jgi:hypothetical protein